jgi:hypothetical protein
MKTIKYLERLAKTLAATSAFASQSLVAATLSYHASTGMLPSAQGWAHFGSSLAETNYSLVNGSLLQGNTGAIENLQYYQSSGIAFDFDKDEVTVSATLQIIASGLTHPPDPSGLGYRRAGWSMDVTDTAGRFVALYVGASGLFLLGQNSESSGLVAFDTTSTFHTYTLQIKNTGAVLTVDGNPTATLLLSQFRLVGTNTANTVRFGDNTNAQASSSRLQSLELVVFAPAMEIRFSQVELCWDTRTNAWYQLQYRSDLTTNQWTPLAPGWVQGTGERYCTNDAILPGQAQRFYQVALTNSLPHR